jgi:hypothetical protein
VRGDRAFWRRQFRTCLDQIGQPRDIRHNFRFGDRRFETKESDNQRKFLENLDLDSYPIHDIFEIRHPVELLWHPYNLPLVRIRRTGHFENGSMVLPRESDIINEVIFTENVPDEVFLCFPGGFFDPDSSSLRLRPVGNRLKIPWIPMINLHLIEVNLRVKDNTQTFPCEILHCHLRDEHREFLADGPMTTTFRIGLNRFIIQYKHGSAVIIRKPSIALKYTKCYQSTESPPPPSSLFGAIRDFFGRLW